MLVLMNGRPLNIKWATEHVPAILEAWYPGTQGGNAIADLLLGDAVPGGKLPITWPRERRGIPINYGHNTTQAPENQGKRYWDEESTPLYPFGLGRAQATRPNRVPGASLNLSVPTVSVLASLYRLNI